MKNGKNCRLKAGTREAFTRNSNDSAFKIYRWYLRKTVIIQNLRFIDEKCHECLNFEVCVHMNILLFISFVMLLTICLKSFQHLEATS